MYKATIIAKDNGLIYDAFLPEKDREKKRSDYEIRKGKGEVIFEINAKDATAFRATISSIAKMLSVIEKTSNLQDANNKRN